MKTKTCFKCKQILSVDLFYRNKSKPDGYSIYCRSCQRKNISKQHIEAPIRRKTILNTDTHKWCSKCKTLKLHCEFYKNDGYLRSYCKTCLKNSKEYRVRVYKRKYNITTDDYDQMLAEQNGSCKIYGRIEIDNGKHFAVDHNHETGEIRGLLCCKCNQALGLLNDDSELLSKASLYLKGELK